MGSTFKRAVLEEQTANAIRQWHAGVKQKRKQQQDVSQSSPDHYSSRTISTSPEFSSHHLHRHHRTPTLGDIVTLPVKTEINAENNDQEIVQHDEQIEIAHITQTQFCNQQSS